MPWPTTCCNGNVQTIRASNKTDGLAEPALLHQPICYIDTEGVRTQLSWVYAGTG